MAAPYFIARGWNPRKRAGEGDEENLHSSQNALKSIDFTHERIHAGKAWYFTGHGEQPAGSMRFVTIHVGDTEFHMREFGLKSNQGPFSGTLYEAPVVDVNSLGPEIILNNLNRKSTNTADTHLHADTVLDVNSLGKWLDHGHIFESAGGAIKSISGEISTVVTEWILKPNTVYGAVFVNSSANAAEFTQHMLGYEPD